MFLVICGRVSRPLSVAGVLKCLDQMGHVDTGRVQADSQSSETAEQVPTGVVDGGDVP